MLNKNEIDYELDDDYRAGYDDGYQDAKEEFRLQLFVEYRNGVPHSYLFGPDCKASQLYMEGSRYKTPEEAVIGWLHHDYKKEEDTCAVLMDDEGVIEMPTLSE